VLQTFTGAQAWHNLRLNDNHFRAGLLSLVYLPDAETLSQHAAMELVDVTKVEYRMTMMALRQATVSIKDGQLPPRHPSAATDSLPLPFHCSR
jgi:hypothetical protein